MSEEQRVLITHVQKFIAYQKGAISLARHNADLKGIFSAFKKSVDRKVNKQLQNNIINAILKYYEIAYLIWKLS